MPWNWIILAGFLVGLLLFFAWNWGHLVDNVGRLEKVLAKLVDSEKRKGFDAIQTALQKDEFLRSAWASYELTLFTAEGSRQATRARAESYFRTADILSAGMRLRRIVATPALLVGGGILGTFCGLAFGIQGFDTSTDKIAGSIETLLAGMSLAFVSSIAGMLLSLMFNLIEKHHLSKISIKVNKLVDLLNREFFVTAGEQDRLHREASLHLLTEVFAHRDESTGETVMPGTVFQRLRDEAEEQSAILKRISSDEEEGIRFSESSLDLLQQKMSAALAPTLEKIESQAEKSTEILIDEIMAQISGGIADTAVAQINAVGSTVGEIGASLSGLPAALKAAQEEMSSHLVNAISQGGEELSAATDLMREQMSAVVSSLGTEVKESQARTKEQLEGMQRAQKEMQDGLGEAVAGASTEMLAGFERGAAAFDGAAGRMRGEVEATLAEFAKSITVSEEKSRELQQQTQSQLAESVATAGAEMAKVVELMNQNVGQAARAFSTELEASQTRTEQLLLSEEQRTAELVGLSESLKGTLEATGVMVESIRAATAELTGSAKELSTVHSRLNSVSDRFKSVAELLGETVNGLSETHANAHQNIERSLEKTVDLLERTQSLATETVERYQTVEDGLKGVFAQLAEGLKGYREGTKEALNKYLGDFASQLQTATSSLSDTVVALGETSEELVDAMETIVTRVDELGSGRG